MIKHMHSLQWFRQRVKKRIYRDKVKCKCITCIENGDTGILITDIHHAEYLYTISHNIKILYRDVQ